MRGSQVEYSTRSRKPYSLKEESPNRFAHTFRRFTTLSVLPSGRSIAVIVIRVRHMIRTHTLAAGLRPTSYGTSSSGRHTDRTLKSPYDYGACI